MKIGIDISQLAFPGTGVAVYTRNLVENLLETGGEYVLFGSSLRQQRAFKIFPHAKVFPFPPTFTEMVWNKFHVFPIENLIGKVDIFHSSDWTQPPTRAKKVTTIHDLVVYKYPESSHPKIIAAQKRRLEWVKKECDLIIAVSQSTKKDIMEILKIPEGKIRVVYEATNFKKPLEKYSNNKPYILAVGTREPRKNIARLVAAYKNLNDKNLDLIIAGKYGWGEENIKGVKLLGQVNTDDLVKLYAGAIAFVYPSLYEGFGLPILEAFSCGCPVITSNLSSMPEVGGDAAIYVDPLKVDDITEKIKHVLSLDRDKLAKKGNTQLQKFSWENTAKETYKVYEELA